MTRAHSERDDVVLGPGQDVGFTVVFPDLPEDFASAKERYRYEVRVGERQRVEEKPESRTRDE